MCVVSAIGDNFNKQIPYRYPSITPYIDYDVRPTVTREEFLALKKEVEELVKLLKSAKIFDEMTGQKKCHMDEKVATIKKIAEWLEVDLEEVFS